MCYPFLFLRLPFSTQLALLTCVGVGVSIDVGVDFAKCSAPSLFSARAHYTPFYTSLLVCINFVPGTPLARSLRLSPTRCSHVLHAQVQRLVTFAVVFCCFCFYFKFCASALCALRAFCNCSYLAQAKSNWKKQKQPQQKENCVNLY